MSENIEYNILQPFGPAIGLVKLPDNIITKLITITDDILSNPERVNYGDNLVGQIEEENLIPIELLKTENLYDFFNSIVNEHLSRQLINQNIQTKNKSWNFGPKKENFKRVIDVVKMIQSYKKIRYKIGNKSEQKETRVLRLNSSKANKILKWSSLMNLDKSIKKTLEWNELAKKGIPKKKICENQFLMYIKNQ